MSKRSMVVPFSKLNRRAQMFPIGRYRHCNGQLAGQNGNRKHHNDEHHLIIEEMARDYLAHHDLAIRNLTNELSDAIHLSDNEKFAFKQRFLLTKFTKRLVNSKCRCV